MSYVMPSQRGYEYVAQSDAAHPAIPQVTRMETPGVSYSEFSNPQTMPGGPGMQPGAQASFVVDEPYHMPRIGETRCYWALLSSDLHFIYLDPVLASHLEEQADSLVGKSLLSFVHPDEQASAKKDLGDVLESRILHGSVTRVRYSRLSRVRRELGDGTVEVTWPDADKIALDANYMAVDIVINWAAEGLVLCFIHAVVDLTPNDNDEVHKTEWTNWCGTPRMEMGQVELLYHRLLVCSPQTEAMTRVFQILGNDKDKPLLMSWPPDSGHTGMPSAQDFARLVTTVHFENSGTNENDAKTSCTRRYKSLRDIPSGLAKVESIFIPHGAIIFACHKLDRSNLPPATLPPAYGYANPSYPEATYQMQTPAYDGYIPQQQFSTQPQYQSSQWAADPANSQYNHWPTPNSVPPISAAANLRPSPFTSQQDQNSWHPPSPQYGEQGDSSSYPRTTTPNYGHPPRSASAGGSTSAVSDSVPPSKRRASPSSSSAGGRPGGTRPLGVLKCSSCKATSSPEWRKGPTGKKELCNACGLRYARSRAKKEGASSGSRRRKDKGLPTEIKQTSHRPPSPSGSYSSLRRGGYDDSPFISNSPAGPGSGSDMYTHSGPHTLDGVTPSPSPPASQMHFSHYPAYGGPNHNMVDTHHHHPYSTSTNSFYSVPSPLSNPHAATHSPHHNPSSSYERMSQDLASGSPIMASPLSTMAPSSFERDRRESPSMPADPRFPS
ncbi:hypothetical protein PLICRDRAFT_174736 [Plicaturopsis crispa FD-325 SS-3]|nr:hypothetical protein PLICRDRAFT_174736 [Plicaturopsis crispa FD-325 SS-3]